MNSKESQFLIDFISNKYLNPAERKRAIELAFKELGENSISISEKKELRSYLMKRAGSSEEAEEKHSKEAIIQPNPKDVAEFMSLFNKREGLKYLTHDFDESGDFNIDEFLISAKKVFDENTTKLNIPNSLFIIVQRYAFASEQTEWSSISEDFNKTFKVNIGWASKELRDWSIQNRLHPIRNEKYRKVINDFRRITRIEPPNLEKLVDSALIGALGELKSAFKINKIALPKADFYSHVRDLKIAFEDIFKEIKKRSDSKEKKEISIEYQRAVSDDGFYLRKILITHHNSYPSKELKLILSEWKEKGSMGKIEAKLKGFCHWSVETSIDNSPTRINILSEEGTEEHEMIENDPGGFKHILTFYYK